MEPKKMSDNEIELVQFSLTEDNASIIQKLILLKATELRKEQHLTKSRSHMAAEDFVAQHHLISPISGMELSQWLAHYRNKSRYTRKGLIQSEPNGSGHPEVKDPVQEVERVTVPTPMKDEDTFTKRLANKQGVIDITLQQMIAKCGKIKVGEVWSFPVENEDEARTLASYMPKVSSALGWRKGRKQHTYLYQIFSDRLKIKRLI